MKIKPLYAVLLVAAVALLAVGLTLVFTLQEPEPTPTDQPDIPRYTADQVIDVASARYPVTEVERGAVDIAWEVEYIGNGVWQVQRIYVFKEGFGSYPAGSRLPNHSWFFYETTGEFKQIN